MMKFARVPRWIIDSGTFASLSTTAKAVLPILGISLDKKSDAGRISVNRICELSGLKKSSVYSAMNELEKAGIIRRKNRESYYEFQDSGNRIPVRRNSNSSQTELNSSHAELNSSQTENHPYRPRSNTKNIYQECAHVPVQNRTLDFEGTAHRIGDLAEMIVARTEWPRSLVDRKADRMLCLILSEIAGGAMGEAAQADPVNTVGSEMGKYVHERAQAGDGDRYTKRLANWLDEQYGDLIAGSGVPHVA